MERLPLSHLFRSDVWLARGQSIPLLDDLNGKVLWFPLRHRVRALIFVCQQWHAISCRGTGAKTQVLILSTLMGLMAGKMSKTACHWKCNTLCWVTSCTGEASSSAIVFTGWDAPCLRQWSLRGFFFLFGGKTLVVFLCWKMATSQSLDFENTAPKWFFHLLELIIFLYRLLEVQCNDTQYKPLGNCHDQFGGTTHHSGVFYFHVSRVANRRPEVFSSRLSCSRSTHILFVRYWQDQMERHNFCLTQTKLYQYRIQFIPLIPLKLLTTIMLLLQNVRL